VEALDEAVALWVVRCCTHTLDVQGVEKLIEDVTLELSTLITHKNIGAAEMTHP